MANLMSNPLVPLRSSEIRAAVSLIEQQFPKDTVFQFKAITLREPDRRNAALYLDAQRHGELPKPLPREAFACYYIRHTVRLEISRLCISLHSANKELGSFL
jgi:Cu2+-containing amine oxidase